MRLTPFSAVQVSGIILKREPSGEKFERLYLLAGERGLVPLLMRRPGAKRSFSLPDIFDQVELLVDHKPGSDFSFVREARILRKRTVLGTSYPALARASEFALILHRNLPREVPAEAIYELFETALDAWERGLQPDIVFFKSLYLFARGEGYPILQEWLNQLSDPGRREAKSLVNLPVQDQTLDPKQVKAWIVKLKHYIAHHTDILA